MGWFPCTGKSSKTTTKKKKKKRTPSDRSWIATTSFKNVNVNSSSNANDESPMKDDHIAARTLEEHKQDDHIAAETFALHELGNATDNFSIDNFLGEGGFGKVYKGKLEKTNQIVAIKQLDPNGFQGNREFLVEVLVLSLLHHHSNLVNLIGYCAHGNERLLVYEYMPLGSLDNHLHDVNKKHRLDWNTRMKIAAGAAMGLEYLHDEASPPIIYRDLKCSNILLDEDYHPKLSDFGLAKLGPVGDETHVSTRVMGTCGYCAPEYANSGQLTQKSDIYSFGVVLLEIITGREAVVEAEGKAEMINLVSWARPMFRDRKNFVKMVDPALNGEFPVRGLYQAIAIAAMCVQEHPAMRPAIADVVKALSYLASQTVQPRKCRSQYEEMIGVGIEPK